MNRPALVETASLRRKRGACRSSDDFLAETVTAYTRGTRDGNIMATIPTPQIAVKRTRAVESRVPAMGMLV